MPMTFEEPPPKPPQPHPLPEPPTVDASGDVPMQDASLEGAEEPVRGTVEEAAGDDMEEEEEEEERPAYMRKDYKVTRLARGCLCR